MTHTLLLALALLATPADTEVDGKTVAKADTTSDKVTVWVLEVAGGG